MSESTAPPNDAALAFGPFVLHRAQKLLLENERAVRLGSRAFDLLVALVERAGQVVSRAELEACVWPRSVVEETSLRVHMSALRKVLGDGQGGARYIANVPGRGYSFVAAVLASGEQSATAVSHIENNLPTRLTREIGREDVIADVAAKLDLHRLVSIVGPGGMGKTTVAVAVAEAALGRYPDGVCFVDLAPLADPALVSATLGTALGLALPAGDSIVALCRHLRERRILVLLDNCEHVIDVAAALAERLLGAAPGLRILATSREPLAAAGEWIYRLAGLDAPSADGAPTLQQALAYPAVQLFVERSLANADASLMSEANCAPIAHLCRRLDGMPLAIELAASCMESLGPQGLADRLDQLFELLTRGRRSALPRQRTLQALLDWSYRLLSEPERIVLRRLSVFRAGFSVAAAAAVASCTRVSPVVVVECLIGLAAKSLLAQEARGDEILHRLLYTTRTYAATRLAESGERDAIARRHAEYMRDLLEGAVDHAGPLQPAAWNALYGHVMDDVRSALAWADSRDGDATIGGALAVAAYLPMCGNGRLDEYRQLVELAIAGMAALDPPQPERELQLYTALTNVMSQTTTDDAVRARVAERTIALAEQLGALVPTVTAMYGTCISAFGQADYQTALRYARRTRLLLDDDPAPAVLLGDRLVAMSLHFLGRHAESRVLLEGVLGYPATPILREYSSQVPRTVSMRILLARILWLSGESRQAERVAAEALAIADTEPGLAQMQALGMAVVPIALWLGEFERAALLVERFGELAREHALGYWQSWVEVYRSVLSPRGADDVIAPANRKELDMLCTHDERYAGAIAFARCEQGEVGWCTPEVLRAHGENLLRAAAPDAVPAAAGLFERAWQLAAEEQVLAWQLRIACSLARLAQTGLPGAPESAAAHARLAAVQARFTDGRDSPDLAQARALLADLRAPSPGGS